MNNKHNDCLLADIARSMRFNLGILCDTTAQREVAKLLVDSIEGDDDPWEVTEFSGKIFPTEKWDGYDVEISNGSTLWNIDVFFTTPSEQISAGHAEIDLDAMSTIIRQVIDASPLDNERHLKSIVRAVKRYMSYRSNEDKDVAEWNDYVGYTGDGDTIYSSLSDLARDFYAHDPEELARAMFHGDLKGWNDYVYINGYGNICSIEDLGEHISYDNLASWLYSQGRVTVRVNVQAGEPGEETWDVEIEGNNVSLEDVIERVKHELQHEIEMGYVVLDPATWLIDIDVLGIE